MPKLNDLTDSALTGIRGSVLSNWTKHTLNIPGLFKWPTIATSGTYFGDSGYSSSDGYTYTLITGTDSSTSHTFFKKLSVDDWEKGVLSVSSIIAGSNSTTQQIKKITSIVGTESLANPLFYFGCIRNASKYYNDTFSSSGTHDWPTVGVVNTNTPSVTLIDTITDGSTEYKLSLFGYENSSYLEKPGNSVCVNRDASIVVASVLPLNSTNQFKIIKTTDGGSTWTLSDLSASTAFYDIVFARDAFYTYTYSSSGGTDTYTFYRSVDGATWNQVGTKNITSGIVYNQLKYVSGDFVLLENKNLTYYKTSNFVTWSSDPVTLTSGVNTVFNAMNTFEGSSLVVDTAYDKMFFTNSLRGNLSGKPQASNGWFYETKNNKRTTYPYTFFHAQKNNGLSPEHLNYSAAWYIFDHEVGSENGTLYINKSLADIANIRQEFIDGNSTSLYSSWKNVSQVAGVGALYQQTYSMQNKYSNEFIAHGEFYDSSWSYDGYKTFSSTDLLNWTEVTGNGYSAAFSIYQPNQSNNHWLANKRTTTGFLSVSTTGANGTFTQSTVPTSVRGDSNGIYAHAVGNGSNWLVSGCRYTANTNKAILVSTDSGANFSVLSGVPSNTSRPFAVGYMNGYWVYWKVNGSTGDGIYYSTDLVNWTHNTSVPVGSYLQNCEYINGRYVFYTSGGGGNMISHTDITATSGWTTSYLGFNGGFGNNKFVGHIDLTKYLQVTLRDMTSFSGTWASEDINITDNIILTEQQFFNAKNNANNDNGLDGNSIPYYLNGYWHVISFNGNVYRVKDSRLVV